MEQRVVRPELLDELDSDDPAAVRSRRDLCIINRIMRGEKWIVHHLTPMRGITKVIELGAGEGILTRKMHTARPDISITAVDLAPRPSGLPSDIEWQQTSVLEMDYACDDSTAIIANLFIHHFENNVVRALSQNWRDAGAILIAEPYRSIAFIRMGRLMYPFVNHVTRHDMKISIEAGFHPGELQKLLGDNWAWEEDWNFVGSIRCKGVRR
jgi:2-polyprenyl-3-methyl-5-hydroxy-6-metoxy-1,4-benzoquinol methylase